MSTAILKGYNELMRDDEGEFSIVTPTPVVFNSTKIKRWWKKSYGSTTYESCALIEYQNVYIVVSCGTDVELKISAETSGFEFDVGFNKIGDGNVRRILVVPKAELYNPVNYEDYYYDYRTKSFVETVHGNGSGGFEWTPANLGTSLKLWLDADDASTITLNSNTVSQWSDKSGNENHAVQSIASAQPTYGTRFVNGKNSVSFSNGIYLESGFTPAMNRTLAVVSVFDSASTGLKISMGARQSSNERSYIGINGAVSRFAAGDRPDADGNSLTEGVPLVQIGYHNSSGEMVHYINGIKDIDTTFGGTIGSGVNYFIGGLSEANTINANSGFQGGICEVVALDTQITEEDIPKLNEYFTNKWVNNLNLAFLEYTTKTSTSSFTLLSTGTVDYEVDWGDGTVASYTTNNPTHTYAVAGAYTIKISPTEGSIYRPFFDGVGPAKNEITSVTIDSNDGLSTNLDSAFEDCTFLTTFTCEFSLTSSVTNFGKGFKGTALSSFPLIDTSSVTEISSMFNGVTELTTLPLLDLSSVSTGRYFLASCSGITSLPAFDLSSANNLQGFASNATSLASLPAFTFTSILGRIDQAFKGCSSLTDVPANLFDNCSGLSSLAFDSTFLICALTAQSIENILVSLDTSGSTGVTLSLDGGTNAGKSTWSTAANTAYDSLIAKGWTITFNS